MSLLDLSPFKSAALYKMINAIDSTLHQTRNQTLVYSPKHLFLMMNNNLKLDF